VESPACRLVASALGMIPYSPDVVCRVAAEYPQCEKAEDRERLATELGLPGTGELWNVWSILHGGRYDPVLEEHGLPPFRPGLLPLRESWERP